MKYSKKLLIIFIGTIIIIIGVYVLINKDIGNSNLNYFKKKFDPQTRQMIKKYIFPYQTLAEQKDIVFLYNSIGYLGLYAELYFGKNEDEIETSRSTIKLSNDKILEKYKLNQGFITEYIKTFWKRLYRFF